LTSTSIILTTQLTPLEQVSAPIQDRIYRVLKARNGGVGLPEFRVPLLIPVAILMPVGLFIYGWSAEFVVHWIVPSIGAGIFAAGIMVGFNAIITYILDAYPTYAASAIAAASLLRSLAGFIFPLFAPIMYSALGYGWGTSVLGFFAIAIGWPAPALFWYYGAAIRGRSTYASD
jgi:MFS family permease